jgi:hypothetical protein
MEDVELEAQLQNSIRDLQFAIIQMRCEPGG